MRNSSFQRARIWWLPSAAVGVASVALVLLATVMGSQALAQTVAFDDVPDDAYYTTSVAELSRMGILTGCEEFGGFDVDSFCPGDPIDRKTMAVWVVRILDGQDPPQGGGSRFNDVDCCLPAFWPRFIERMAELGVTRGCGDGSGFCPNRSTTRAEMAVFLSRAFDLPAGPDPNFSDVPADAWYVAEVARLKASGITVGCGDGSRFCPSRTTTRAEMATFLYRAITQGAAAEDLIIGTGLNLTLDVVETKTEDLLTPETIIVHSCGPPGSAYAASSSKLREQVRKLQTYVDAFFRAQSDYLASNGEIIRGSTINFEVGEAFSPVTKPDGTTMVWNQATVARWAYDWFGGKIQDPCTYAAINTYDSSEQLLMLVDIDMGPYFYRHKNRSIAGYAADYGAFPTVVATEEQRSTYTADNGEIYDSEDLFLRTVAHEIGHALYGWYHPFHRSDLSQKDLEDAAKVKRALGPEKSGSIMSYLNYGAKADLRSNAALSRRAYVSCDHRVDEDWALKVGETCERPPRPPDPPDAPDVTAGDGRLSIEWEAPGYNGGAQITDYRVRYRVEGDYNWQPSVTSLSLRTVITGLTNSIVYEVQVAAVNEHGEGTYSAATKRAPRRSGEDPVVLTIGGSAQGQPDCSSPACRWLHVEIDESFFGPGPHTLACAHEGVHQIGITRGVYRSAEINSWPANDACFFGYPGNEVFVIVGAELRGNSWHGGYYSNRVTWPDSDEETLRGTIVNDDPQRRDNNGSFDWWQPMADVNKAGYGNNGFHFTLAIGNSDEVDSWAEWDFGSVHGRYELQAWIPARWATANVRYGIWVDGNYLDGPWLDQQTVSGWQTLGVYDLSGDVEIQVHDSVTRDDYRDVGNEYARLAVDALRLVPQDTNEPEEVEYIYDDMPDREDEVGEESWEKPPPHIDVLGYGSNGFYYTYAIGGDSDSELDNWAQWNFGPVDGRYEVQVWIPADWATAEVQYRMWADENGDSLFTSDEYIDSPWLDQQRSNGWKTLGTYDFKGSVIIQVLDTQSRDDYRIDGLANSRIAVDAMRLRKVD